MKGALLQGVYTLAWRLATPFLLWRIWRRARREPGYGVFPAERFGFYGAAKAEQHAAPVWVHAVSLGETRAAQPLVLALLDRGLPVLLTHMTATGRAEGARLFERDIAQGRLRQAWLPYDMPGAVRRFYRHFLPRCGLLVETEVWPNLVAAGRRHGVPLALVSARLSAASARKTRRVASLARRTYGGLDAVLAQTQADADRLREIGARDPRVVGNLKFDLRLPQELIQAGLDWRRRLGRPVVAWASTREGEEAAILAAVRAMPASAGGIRPLAVVIPRHPQRFDEVAAMAEAAGLAVERRSRLAGMPFPAAAPGTVVLLGDSLGEMPFYYAAADVAIVAGSFAPLGGQNLIEATACGVPVIVGPHTFNFSQASEDAIAARAALRAADVDEAWLQALALLDDAARRQAMREAALQFSGAYTGATARVLAAVGRWLG
ncbi:3-deoxy-D-manno-octulosonic acid transferase [Pigmentiphaga humi]|uniref:3-deoxy-D-manno-octulosonic acid transferase n=1 Tax=Pigmentiphaga humi TaxID=2478468 RepID=A0A3P4B4P5_9BURK|nr:3-deoxy-D-manno-octulosonic acid transferase [Pigmentiphaga humi]